jgi:hypothetical protein
MIPLRRISEGGLLCDAKRSLTKPRQLAPSLMPPFKANNPAIIGWTKNRKLNAPFGRARKTIPLANDHV